MCKNLAGSFSCEVSYFPEILENSGLDIQEIS